jgi:hypothetical protein
MLVLVVYQCEGYVQTVFIPQAAAGQVSMKNERKEAY